MIALTGNKKIVFLLFEFLAVFGALTGLAIGAYTALSLVIAQLLP